MDSAVGMYHFVSVVATVGQAEWEANTARNTNTATTAWECLLTLLHCLPLAQPPLADEEKPVHRLAADGL